MSEKSASVGSRECSRIVFQDDVDDEVTRAIRAPRGGSDPMLVNNDGGICDDLPVKKKKTRRGKPKRRNSKPYSVLSWQQRKDPRSKTNKFRTKMRGVHGQALAPYNTTQFLIEDHGYMKDIEDRLNNSDPINETKNVAGPPRTRDSSFSVDSDVDFYSSPEDEEEFLTKEFSNTYQDMRSERLNAMTREELVQECIQMENKLDLLTKRLSGRSADIEDKVARDTNDVVLNVSTLKDFQVEIMKLMTENDSLRRENEILRQRRRRKSDSVTSSAGSSIDSESDSSSTDTSSSSSDMDALDENGSRRNGDDVSPVDYSKLNGTTSASESPKSGALSPDDGRPTFQNEVAI